VRACIYLYSGHFAETAIDRAAASDETKNRLIDEAYLLLADSSYVFTKGKGKEQGKGKGKSHGKGKGKVQKTQVKTQSKGT
jgi:hypothetical protein